MVVEVRRRLGPEKVSERRACRVLDQPRSTQRYQRSVSADEDRLLREMRRLARQRPRFGAERIHRLLIERHWHVNHKRVHRLWKRENMQVPRKQRRKRRFSGCSENSCVRHRATYKDHVWSYDFVHDRTHNGRPLKILTLVDEYTRECLTLKVDRSITSEDVIDTLAQLFAMRGVRRSIRSDNGPEFIANSICRWLKLVDVETLFIERGSPWKNGFAKSFHSRLQDEFLAIEEFESLTLARRLSTLWQDDYNLNQPHSSLEYQTSAEFAARCAASAPAAPALQRHSNLT